tara:strand:+ start:587 stop:754 length:168 start_codon:yes stop_codon:yes gene_type:complete
MRNRRHNHFRRILYLVVRFLLENLHCVVYKDLDWCACSESIPVDFHGLFARIACL